MRGSAQIDMRNRSFPVAVSLLLIICLAGCGKSSLKPATSAKAGITGITRGPGVTPAAVLVIKGWADALRENHRRRAAAFWALPSAMVNGPDASGSVSVIRIRDAKDALAADDTLPCGATLHAASLSGRYVKAEFTLGARVGVTGSGSECAGPASVDFLIRGGHIVRWLRAPVGSSAPREGGFGSGPAPSSV